MGVLSEADLSQLTPKERAQRAARIAAYGDADAHTPADYTPLEAIQAYGRELEAKKQGSKKKHGKAGSKNRSEPTGSGKAVEGYGRTSPTPTPVRRGRARPTSSLQGALGGSGGKEPKATAK